jgi:hypothetical protein
METMIGFVIGYYFGTQQGRASPGRVTRWQRS